MRITTIDGVMFDEIISFQITVNAEGQTIDVCCTYKGKPCRYIVDIERVTLDVANV